jgi:hypothetical protein
LDSKLFSINNITAHWNECKICVIL